MDVRLASGHVSSDNWKPAGSKKWFDADRLLGQIPRKQKSFFTRTYGIYLKWNLYPTPALTAQWQQWKIVNKLAALRSYLSVYGCVLR